MRAPDAGGNDLNFRRRGTPAERHIHGSGWSRRGAALHRGFSQCGQSDYPNRQPFGCRNTCSRSRRKRLWAIMPCPAGFPLFPRWQMAGRSIAIDTQNTLFFSNDAGAHWNIVTQPWQGRAVKVELVSSSYPAGTRFGAAAPAPVGVASGTGPKVLLRDRKPASTARSPTRLARLFQMHPW